MATDFMWREDRKNLMYDKARDDVDFSFAEIAKKKRLGFSYREDQHKFAKDIMNAIKENQILLVQAGVGIGKSMGYLIPIFASFKNVSNFEKVVISTSNIALQQQLLTDINYVSKLLKVDLKVEVAKGINNYVCLRKIYDLFNHTHNPKLRDVLKGLEEEINKKQTIDKSNLSKISENIWKKIQLTNRGACSNCPYSRSCLFKHHVDEVKKADIIVTNHAYFVNAAKSNSEIINGADMYVFDEAHALEDSIRNVNERELRLKNIQHDLFYFSDESYIKDEGFYNYVSKLSGDLVNLFCKIRGESLYTFNKNCKDETINVTDCDKIPIDGNKFSSELNSIIHSLKCVIKYVSKYDALFNNDAKKILSNLKKYRSLFLDLSRGSNDSKCIYWASFFEDDKIDLGYVLKNDYDAIKNIFGGDNPVICTSATMLDANGGYGYFREWLHLNDKQLSERSIVDGKVYASPFNYKRNSIFYYDTTVSNPNDYDNYIYDLVDRIKNILLITEGKALVLFTAKSTMKQVLDILSKENLGYNLIMQGQCDNSILCEKFETDTNSCLFATGSFWEGIDIKGEALSNVIITRLPFAVVDAVTKNKASKFSRNDSFKMVYLNDMVKKLAQGCGRLIRNKNDKGIICCLDPRVVKYLDAIKNCTPYVNYTNNIDDIIKFSNKYIKKLSK